MTSPSPSASSAFPSASSAFPSASPASPPASSPSSNDSTADVPLDGVALAALVEAGEVTALELTEQAIQRTESVNTQINAVIRTTYDAAREAAAAIDAARSTARSAGGDSVGGSGAHSGGRLVGVPFHTKDLQCTTAGEPHYMGNAALKDADFRADATSYLTTMLAELGMVNLGYTNTPEFGLTVTTEPLSYGPSANPWNLEHSSGGSSGGSAAIVAAGAVPIGQGGDGGGSLRVPAANCGLFSLKPNRGRVSHGPQAGEGWAGASIAGVMTRSVRDSAAALDGICRPWPGDPYWAPLPDEPFETSIAADPPPLRVGLCAHSGWGDVHPECTQAVTDAGSLLEGLGHQVDYASPDELFDEGFFANYGTVLAASNAAMVEKLGTTLGRPFRHDDVEGDTWALVEAGRTITGTQYLEGLSWFHTYDRAMLAWWVDHDVLVTPVLTEPPPRLGELRDPVNHPGRLGELLHFTAQFNVTGQPAMSVPLHWTPEGLPVGVQFVGAQCAEATLLQLAAQLERAAPWAHRRPPIWAS